MRPLAVLLLHQRALAARPFPQEEAKEPAGSTEKLDAQLAGQLAAAIRRAAPHTELAEVAKVAKNVSKR